MKTLTWLNPTVLGDPSAACLPLVSLKNKPIPRGFHSFTKSGPNSYILHGGLIGPEGEYDRTYQVSTSAP